MNNVRRKATGNQALAKRCRQLVKAWQQLAPPTNASVTPPVNSSRNASPAPARSPAVNSARRSPVAANISSSSPKLVNHNAKGSSPALQPHTKGRLVSPAQGRVASPAGRLVSPLVRGESAASLHKTQPHSTKTKTSKPISPASAGSVTGSAAAQLKRISPSNSRLTAPNSSNTPYVSVSPASIPSRPDTPNSIGGRAKDVNSVGSRTRTPTPTPINNNHSSQTPNNDQTNRKHAANKKRRRSDDSINSEASSIKRQRPLVNGEVAHRPSEIKTKTPKVKTTVELIAELQATKSTRLTSSDTITKIVTNQYEKEEDDINVSVVPQSAKPRHRRKNAASTIPAPPAAPADLSRTKSDLVQRFLQQVEQSKDDEDVDVDVLGTESFEPPRPVIDLSIDPYSLLPPLNYEEIRWSDDDEPDTSVFQRNAITGEYPEGCDRSPSVASEPDERIIEKIVEGEWNGVNGTVNVNNGFNPWTETFTITPDEGEVVHVLPYVDI